MSGPSTTRGACSLITGRDVEAEHLAALASLTAEQRTALHRLREALRIGSFNHHSLKEVLMEAFRREAAERVRDGEAAQGAITAQALEREHLAAMASLSVSQRDALHRIDRALQIGNFSHQSLKDILLRLFDAEAAKRNASPPGP